MEVNLPLGMSLFHNKKLSIQIICQLLADVDMDTVNDGRIKNISMNSRGMVWRFVHLISSLLFL